MWIIYKATNKINDKLYIGQTKNKLQRRIKEHERSLGKSVFHSAIEKYGKENFQWSVVGMCFTLEDANRLEESFIKRLKTHVSEHGYNIQLGGRNHSGYTHTEETKKQMSESRKGVPVHSKEHKEKLRERMSGKGNPMFGKRVIHTAAAREKMSKANKGKILSDSTKHKISKSRRGTTLSDSTKQKISKHSSKSVICIETDQIFTSVKEACSFLGKSYGGQIGQVCYGKRKTAHGYTWKWLEDYKEEETP